MKHRTLICLSFLALFLFSSSFFLTSIGPLAPQGLESITDNNSIKAIPGAALAPDAPPLPEGPTWDGNEYLYEGLGQILNAQEFSHGDNSSLQVIDLDYGETDTGQIEIPSGWTGYQLTATVYNLFDNITHIDGGLRNGNFESGTGSPTFWSEDSRGMSGSGLYWIDWNYGAYGVGGSDGVNVVANCSSYNWISNATYIEFVGWTQTIDLNRIDVEWAKLTFDVQFYDMGYGSNDEDEMAIYVEVGGVRRTFVCHRYAPNARNYGWGFHPITYSLSVDELQTWTSDTIDVTIGLTVDFDWNIGEPYAMDFDNVKLQIKGKASPNDNAVQLRLNNIGGTSWTNLDYGTGTISISGTWGPYGVDSYIDATWNTTNSRSRDVNFDYTLTLYIRRSKTTESQTGPEGTAFWVKHGTSVYWTAWFRADFHSTYYANYNLTIEKPTTEIWTLYEVWDPNLNDKTSAVQGDSNSSHVILTPSTINAIFGWWNFTFSSTNRISSVSGVQNTYYISPRSPNQLSITVFLSKTTGEVNLTLYNPSGDVANESSKAAAASVPFTVDFNDGDAFPAGQYTLCLSYDDDITTAAGFYSTQFAIIHDTLLTIEQGASSLTVTYGGGTFFVRLTYDDLDKTVNPWVANTTGTVEINGTVDGNFIVFQQFGNLYQAEISNSLLSPGDYILSVGADDPYHESATDTILLLVRSDATLTSPESPGVTVPYAESFTVQVFYEDEWGDGIPLATVTTDWPTNPTGSGNGTDGWYNIVIDTADQPGPGTYSLTIQAERNYYTTRTLILTIVVREISTTINYIPPGSVPWGEDVVIDLDFYANDPESTVYDGNPISGASFALQLGVTPLTEGPDYTLVDHLDGTYTITLLASSGRISTIQSYTLYIQAYPSSPYGDGAATVGFQISGHQTQTIVVQPDPTAYGDTTDGITVQWNDLNGTSLNPYPSFFDYLEVRNATDSSLIATRTSLIFDLDTSTWLPGTYDLTVTTFPATNLYFGSTGSLRIIINIHQTAVTILPPEPTPWGETTNITIQWVDLSTGGYISVNQAWEIRITGAVSDVITWPTSWTITLDTSGLMIAGSPYSITVRVRAKTVPNRIYADSNSTFNELTIRGHRVYVLVTGPPPVPEDGSISISVDWTDLDTGNPINPSFLLQIDVTQISGPSAPTLPASFTLLDFVIDATGWGRGIHRLNITVYSNDIRFQTGFGPVNVVIRVHSINADVDPIPRVPYGNDVIIILRVNDSDLVPPAGLPEHHIASVVISGGPSTITLDNLNWALWVNNGTAGDGIYEITLDVSSWSLSTYALQFDVYTSAEYGDGVVLTQLIIRPLAISFTYQSPPVVPWGEDGLLIVTYVVSDDAIQDGNPIEPPGITITIAGLTRFTHFDYAYWVNGKYNITFYSAYLTSVQTYQFDITITKSAEYTDGQLDDVPLTVRALFTWLHPTAVPLTPFGDNVTIEVAYEVLDGESSLNGQPIYEGTESITVTGLYGFNPGSYSWEWVGALSVYRITIDASAILAAGGIGEYRIMISISGSGVGYEPDTIPELTFNVRTVFTAMAVEPVDAQAYLDNFTIRVTYTVNDPDSSINGQGIIGQEAIISLVGYVGSFDVIPQGLGVYDIVINSTVVGAPGSYGVIVNTTWPTAPPPYAVQTKSVTLFVTERPTDIRNTVTGEYGYLDEIIVNFTYSDQLRAFWITNASYGGNHVYIIVYNATPVIPVPISTDAWYVLSITGADAFQLRIDADYFGKVNVFFDFKVEVYWETLTAPYFETQEFEFRAYVVGQRTDVIIQPSAGATPYGTNMIIEFRYITEQGHGINQTDWPQIDITLLCEQIPSFGVKETDWDYTFVENGKYEIWIDTTLLLGIGSYTFYVNVTYPGGEIPFFESQYNEPAPRLVRYIDTLLEYDDPGPLYAGDDLILTVQYYDLDNDQHVPNVPPIDFVITGGTVLSRIQLPSQFWEITIDTSGLPAGGEFTLWIFANQSYYYWQNISAQVYIYRVPLDIKLETPGVIERYYGEPDQANITVTITIDAGSLAGTYVTDALLEGFWDNPRLTNWHNYGNGTYTIALSTTYAVERYPIEIRASKVIGPYSNASIFITYTITAGPSQLLPPFGTTQLVYIGNVYNITVIYQTPSGDPLRSADGAVVTYSSLDLGVDNFPMVEIAPGIYQWNFSSIGYLRGIITISVKATFPNVQSGTQFFTIDARETPAEIQVDNPVIGVYYNELFSVNVTLMQILDNIPLPGEIIEALWQGNIYTLIHTGGGNYTFSFLANLTAGRNYDLPLDLITTSYDCDTLTLQISIISRPMQRIDLIGSWTYYPGAVNNTVSLLNPNAPMGDMFYLVFSYIDYEGFAVPGGGGTATIGTTPVALQYHSGYGGYLLAFNTSQFGIETFNVFVSIGKDNYETQVDQFTITLRRINTELHLVELLGNVSSSLIYVNQPFEMLVYLEDTDHNWGVADANFTLPLGWWSEKDLEMGQGYYRIYGLQPAPAMLSIEISAIKNRPFEHTTATLQMTLEFQLDPTVVMLTYAGIASAIILIVVLVSWTLWTRVFSIPWEVRRMRKLAKQVERDENYNLSKKDLKRFRARSVTMSDSVEKAMATIGVAATPVMVPKPEEIEEVTATEEDIMGELDKIPGLGPEEKAVLAEEMRKIPRKDRIWFLDDLRRQMGQRRMDVITARERPVVPEKPKPPVKKKPKAKPKVTPEVKPEEKPEVPLEEVKPEEPPPPSERALEEERTAPTVLPPEMQPPPAPDKVVAEIRRELDKIPGLNAEEKEALVDHLKYLSKEEREATYRSLRQSANDS